jgi:hypothetical protein
LDIKKRSKTRQAKREEYVVLEPAVHPGPSYSIPTTSVVSASSLFMMLAAGQLMKMTTGFVPRATGSQKKRVMPILLQQRQSKSKMKTISPTHVDLSFGVPASLSPLSSPLSSRIQQQQEQQGQHGHVGVAAQDDDDWWASKINLGTKKACSFGHHVPERH